MTSTKVNVVHEPGRIDKLTPEQEEKLKEMWAQILTYIGFIPHDLKSTGSVLSNRSVESKKKKKSKRSFFGMGKGDKKEVNKNETEAKAFKESLNGLTGEQVGQGLFKMLKGDNPDNLFLRFLRARKWDVKAALQMLGATFAWRHENNVDDSLYTGERVAFETNDKGFLHLARVKESYIWGHDFRGRPIVHVKTYNHDPKAQTEEDIAKFTIYVIETARLCMKDPVDTAAVFFDLSGFSMSNMDYGPVKFLIQAFEKHFPECLGFLLIHNAPWVFTGIWNVIKGWIDPVVASKIKFTKTLDDVSQYIPVEFIEKNLGGQSEHTYEYIEPKEGENKLMEDTATKEKLTAEREIIWNNFVEATISWIKNEDKTTDAEAQAKKTQYAAELYENYWALDPYIRSRSVFDRNGCLEDFRKLHSDPDFK